MVRSACRVLLVLSVRPSISLNLLVHVLLATTVQRGNHPKLHLPSSASLVISVSSDLLHLSLVLAVHIREVVDKPSVCHARLGPTALT